MFLHKRTPLHGPWLSASHPKYLSLAVGLAVDPFPGSGGGRSRLCRCSHKSQDIVSSTVVDFLTSPQLPQLFVFLFFCFFLTKQLVPKIVSL